MKTIEEIINEEGFFMSTTSGVSMYPMLRDRKDTIVIQKNNIMINMMLSYIKEMECISYIES